MKSGTKMSFGNEGFGRESRCCGILTAILIAAAAFVLSLGAILGAVFATFVTENLVVFAAFAIVFAIILALLLIARACRSCSCNCG